MLHRPRSLVPPGVGLFALLSAFVSAWALAGGAHAQDATLIDLEMRVIYAVKGKGVVDPDCREIQKRLPMSFGSLQTVQSEHFELAPGSPAEFELPTGRAVRMMPVSIVGPHLHIHFELSGIMSTRMQMVSGHPVIVGGEKYGDGQLILELTPSFRPLGGPSAPSANVPKGPVVRRVRATPPNSR